MNTPQMIDLLVDFAPFFLYSGLLLKLLFSWRKLKGIDRCRRSKISALLLLVTVVVATFLSANVYALMVYGKTFLSIRVFQMFVVGNCLVYWLLVDQLTKYACKQGTLCDAAD
ncbi:hypothetical protein D3C85_691800 [compost metagenome]